MIKNSIITAIFTLFLFSISGCDTKSTEEIKPDIDIKEENRTSKVEIETKEELIETGVISDGAKIYKENIEQFCSMSGYELARKNSKDEWKRLAKNGEIAKTIKVICPGVEFDNNWTPDIYEFLHKNALAS